MTEPATPPAGFGREEAQAMAGAVALLLITAAWWALALWPVEAAPGWLARTRAVCFGVEESGLPDLGGWIGLIGGPAGMLAILVAGWHRGFRGILRRAPASRGVAVTVGGIGLAAALLLTGAGWRVQQQLAAAVPTASLPAPPAETHPRLDRPAPPLDLVSQKGDTLRLGSLAGRPALVTFAFAHCATVCPLLVQNALRARRTLAGEPSEPAVVVITLDPWRDRPGRLPTMAEGWALPDRGAWLLSGSVERVESVLDAWEVPRTRDRSTGQIVHPALTYVLDAEGRIAHATTGDADTLVGLLRGL